LLERNLVKRRKGRTRRKRKERRKMRHPENTKIATSVSN